MTQKQVLVHFHRLNTLIVSAYKVIGFAVLSAILIGLGSYLAVNLFYLVDRSWVAPTILSPTDPRVLQINAQLMDQSAQRDRLFSDLLQLRAKQTDQDRILDTEQRYQRSLGRTVQADRDARQQDLRSLQRITQDENLAASEIRTSSRAFSGLSRSRLRELMRAQLIDSDRYIEGNYQLSQLARANLGLAEDQALIGIRRDGLRRDALALGSIAQQPGGAEDGDALTYDVLRIRQDWNRSMLDAERARDTGAALRQGLGAMEAALLRYDRLIKALRESPYLKAVEHNLNVAFVPYENLDNVTSGVPVYGCSIGLLWCKEVGRVVEALAGEVIEPHPLHNRPVRGLMVQMDLKDGRWAQQKVLYSGRAPLLL